MLLRWLLRCRRALRRGAQRVGVDGQVAYERHARPRDGEIARRKGPIRHRLLEEQPRLREIRLCRDSFPVAKLIDAVRALSLLRRSATRLERRFRRLELVQRDARIERGQLLRLLEPSARLVQIRLRDFHLPSHSAAAEEREIDRAAHRPVLAELIERREHVAREKQALVVRGQRERGKKVGACGLQLAFLRAHRFLALPHGRASRGGRIACRDAGLGVCTRRRVRRDDPRDGGRLVDGGREQERCVERQIEQLLEPQIRHSAIAAPSDEHGTLVVAGHRGAEQIELAQIPHLSRDRGLTQEFLRLRERRVRDDDEAVGEHRVEVGLRHVERELRALRTEIDLRGPLLRVGGGGLSGDASTRVDALRQREPEGVLIARAEPHLAEVDPLHRGAGGRLRQRGGAFGGCRVRVNPWRAHRLRLGCGRRRGAVRRRAAGQRGKLRAQRARVSEIRVELRQILAARLLELSRCARDAGSRDLERLTFARGEPNRLVE